LNYKRETWGWKIKNAKSITRGKQRWEEAGREHRMND
jgi:hypothetical protein